MTARGSSMSLLELGERRLQAGEAKTAATRDYEAIRRTLRVKRFDVDTDPAVIAALAACEEAMTTFELARREHGLALSADLKVRQRGG
jgi:hypothetical protein